MPGARRCLWSLLLLLLLGTAPAQARTALVIGNAAYPDQPLPQALHDAAGLAAALRELGFTVIHRENLDRRGLIEALREFTAAGTTGPVLFYYAGQGAEARRHTYLIPLGATVENSADLELEAVALQWVVQQMQQTAATPRIVIVDVPRIDPFGPEVAALPPLPIPPQSLIVWSTSPGSAPVSGVYARQLLLQLRRPGVTIDDLFRTVWQRVVETTDSRQIPRDSATLDGTPLYLVPPTPVLSSLPAPPSPPPAAPPEQPVTATTTVVTTPYEFRDRLQQGGDGPVLVALPAGEFWIGSPETEGGRDADERRRRLRVGAFAIGKYEVTFTEYDRFAQATGRAKTDDRGWGRGNRPVINVSAEDALAYTDWLSAQTGQRYRLPTEAEWEYAARAGTTTAYSWGDDSGRGNANCRGCGSRWDARQTAPVASFAANAFGLHDMAGNVAEWTCSLYAPDYDGAELRCAAAGETEARVLRGDAWDGDVLGIRSANRARLAADFRTNNLGFRLARSL